MHYGSKYHNTVNYSVGFPEDQKEEALVQILLFRRENIQE